MKYAFPAPPQPVADIVASDDKFPVRRIFCVGQNYADHVKEMGGDATKPDPFFFCKPGDAVVASGATIPYATQTTDLQHEIELVIAIGKAGSSIARANALTHVFGYAVGCDLTRRDLQKKAKDERRPWDVSKGFDNSAPLGFVTPWQGELPGASRISLSVNGVKKQDATLDQMIWPVADIIAFASKFWTLQPGDLIFTGTPSGVGPVKSGDTITGHIDHLTDLMFKIG
jgi:fumarylpyruvate hydrolase